MILCLSGIADGIPQDDGGRAAEDIVHATHEFVYVPPLRPNSNFVFDKQPDYARDVGQERIRKMINAYRREIDAPTATFAEFISLAEHGSLRGDAAVERGALQERLDARPAPEWFIDEPDAHAFAPG
ncbi:MAG: hypothetical protein J07HX5_00020 [halophilic archaeon J07HX5]|nr:MAG: hypothetical protein J07HX5_00020 [halophilic archaeon J07HX5]